jgi:DNA-binding transcriptional regulator YiaG
MTNIASVLKTEIVRVARKEIRSEIESLRKANSQHRSAIALLRRQVAELQKQLRLAGRQAAAAARVASSGAPPVSSTGDGTPRRFSASRLAAHRAKLGLSAAAYGRLMGVSDQTIYNWEQGKTRPSAQQLQRVAAVRALSRPTAIERLSA